MYKFKHSPQDRTVYKYPAEPNVIEQKDKRGKRTGWSVNMEVLITRADNVLTHNQWKFKTSDYPSQPFEPRYRRDEVISYFLMNHAPAGDEITEAEYVALHAQYDAAARAPKQQR